MTRAQLRLFHFFLTNFERTRCSRPQVTHSLTRRSACGQSTGSSTGWRWQTRARSTSSSTNASSTRDTSVFSQKTQRSFASASCNHAAGELQFANRATNMSVFETENPTVATPLREGWIGISDRHYLIGPRQRQIEINYEHRLSHNMSLHMNALDRWTHIAEGPMWWFAISDIHNVVQHHNITLRTVGTVDTVSLDDE